MHHFKLRSFFIILPVIVGFILYSFPVQAEEGVGFSVQAILPENQANPKVSYFDMQIEPDAYQEIQVMIYNHTIEELTVEVSVFDSTTSRDGTILYENLKEPGGTPDYPLSEIAALKQKEIVIQGGASVPITLAIDTPPESFEGVILGGLNIKKVNKSNAGKKNEGLSLQNEYAYLIGVKLTQGEVVIAPNFQVKKVEPTQVYSKTAVVAEIQNTEPTLASDIDIQAEVYEDGNELPIYEKTLTASFAPNSAMDFTLDEWETPLEAGEYSVVIRMTEKETEKIWEFNHSFKIENKAAALHAREFQDENPSGSGFHPLIFLLSGIILFLLCYIWMLRKKTEQPSEQKA